MRVTDRNCRRRSGRWSDVLAILDYTLMETLASENSVVRGKLLVALAAAYMDAFKAGDFDNRSAAIQAALKIWERK